MNWKSSYEDSWALLIASLSGRYIFERNEGIPAQWQRFSPYIGSAPEQVGWTTYGACCNSDDAGSFEYICGVEVSDFSDNPEELSRIRIPDQRYAVFTHRGHISTIRRTAYTIWNKYLPESGLSWRMGRTSSALMSASILRAVPERAKSGFQSSTDSQYYICNY